MNETPAKPRIIIAQMEGSGTTALLYEIGGDEDPVFRLTKERADVS
jgi:hypothetical protein